MNALSRALKPQAPRDSGEWRVFKATPAKPSAQNMVFTTISAEHVRTLGGLEATFVTQRLTLDEKCWSASNLDQVLGAGSIVPSAEELVAARRAVANIASRAGEDDRTWAKELGEQLGSFTD